MKLRFNNILFAAVLLLVTLPSCKEKEETKEYMNGTLLVESDLTEYVQAGERFTFKPSGITAPDGTEVGYYFTLPISSRKDTLRNGASSYTYEIPDTLGTFSINCIAYPVQSSDKYYVSSHTEYFTIVSDDSVNGSISNVAPRKGDVAVNVGGRECYSANLGGCEWMLSNLCIVNRDSDGKELFGRSYRGSAAMQNVFGAFYTWEEARNACPDGWHLPSEAEWVSLLKANGAPESLKPLDSSPCGAGKLMVKAYFNKAVMWDYYRNVTISDEGIRALPVGYANILDDKYEFTGYSEYAVFWTADEYEGMGVYRYINEKYDNVFAGVADKNSFAASVRCVR